MVWFSASSQLLGCGIALLAAGNTCILELKLEKLGFVPQELVCSLLPSCLNDFGGEEGITKQKPKQWPFLYDLPAVKK